MTEILHRMHVPEPPGYDPQSPPTIPPGSEPGREIDLPPLDNPDVIRDPDMPPEVAPVPEPQQPPPAVH